MNKSKPSNSPKFKPEKFGLRPAPQPPKPRPQPTSSPKKPIGK